MATKKLTKYVAKRHVATREDPTAPAVVLGIVKGASMTEAGEAATLRWGCDGENDLMVLIPVGKATEFDLRLAVMAEADETYGKSYGKRRRVECPCGLVQYVHPKQPLQTAACLCGRNLFKYPWTVVDMVRECEAMKGKP